MYKFGIILLITMHFLMFRKINCALNFLSGNLGLDGGPNLGIGSSSLLAGGLIGPPIGPSSSLSGGLNFNKIQPISSKFSLPLTASSIGLSSNNKIGRNFDFLSPPPRPEFKFNMLEPLKSLRNNKNNNNEERVGDIIRGEYTVEEPDGTIRVVKYTTDKKNGKNNFNSHVSRSGKSILSNDDDNNNKSNEETLNNNNNNNSNKGLGIF